MSNMIATPAGYEYETPDTTGKPDVNISLPYAEAFDIILDGIECEATIEPLTQPTFKALAENLLGLLIDASKDANEPEAETL